MPFSVLRVWLFALFSWALLALGVYFAVEAYRQLNRPDRQVAVAVPADTSEPGPLEGDAAEVTPAARTMTVTRKSWQPWAYLAGAVLCLGWSVGGSWPVKYLLGHRHGQEIQDISPRSTLKVDRPDGSLLHVETYGLATGPALILTHGWSLDSSAWSYLKGDLAKHYRVVVWDLAGLGQSKAPKNADHSIEKMAADLEAVMQRTCPDEPVILVGHSIGGMIQQTFCRLFAHHIGQRVKGMVFVHTTYTDPLKTNFAAPLTTALKPVIIPLNYLMIVLAPLTWLSNWQSYYNGSMHLTTRFTSFSGKQTRQQLDHSSRLGARAWPAVIARGNFAMMKFDEQKTLQSLPIPVLVIAGKNDRMTVAEASRHIETILPNDRPYQTDGGHLGHWEHAGQVAEVVQQFAQETLQAATNPADLSTALLNTAKRST